MHLITFFRVGELGHIFQQKYHVVTLPQMPWVSFEKKIGAYTDIHIFFKFGKVLSVFCHQREVVFFEDLVWSSPWIIIVNMYQ